VSWGGSLVPVSVGRCGSKWCVKDPDGSTVPGGTHGTEEEANSHARAINANMEKGVMDTIKTTESVTVSGVANDAAVTTDRVLIKNTTTFNDKQLQFPKLEPEIQDAIKEKGLEEALMFGPESFDDLDALREHNDQQKAITKVVSDFMALVGNVFSWPGPGKSKKVKELASEMVKRLPEEGEEPEDSSIAPDMPYEEIVEDSPEEVKEVDKVESADKGGFFIWKEADGTYRWLGAYSNKYRDDDRPAEILSEKAHLEFIERVEKGELAYPDLYVWHVKSPIGIADLLAYDDAGFSIASGTIEEEFALALEKTSEVLAMSHGMPSESIQRSKEDPTVITSYVSTEVSVLPRYAAANKRTAFHILKEEATMSIVPADKRQQITALLGEDLTARLETGLSDTAKEAEDANVESKEQAVETEVVEGSEVITETDATEDLAQTEAPAEEAEAEEAANEEAVKDEPAATLEGDVGTEAADGSMFVNKNELAETLATIVTNVIESNAIMLEGIKSLNARIDVIEAVDREKKASQQASEQLTELAASVPMASLKELLAKQLAEPARSVIGNKETAVHGNSTLANASPKETEFDEENPDPNAGLFFHRW